MTLQRTLKQPAEEFQLRDPDFDLLILEAEARLYLLVRNAGFVSHMTHRCPRLWWRVAKLFSSKQNQGHRPGLWNGQNLRPRR